MHVRISGVMSTSLLWVTFSMQNDAIIPISVYFFNNDTWDDTIRGMLTISSLFILLPMNFVSNWYMPLVRPVETAASLKSLWALLIGCTALQTYLVGWYNCGLAIPKLKQRFRPLRRPKKDFGNQTEQPPGQEIENWTFRLLEKCFTCGLARVPLFIILRIHYNEPTWCSDSVQWITERQLVQKRPQVAQIPYI